MLNYILPFELWKDGPRAVLEHLSDPQLRAKCGEELRDADFENFVIAWLESERNKKFVGKSLSIVAEELGVEPVVRADTAGAAQEVAELGDPTIAAIASQLAGDTYGLLSLRTRIEDRLGNTTRFVVMSRRREEPDPRGGPCLTSFVFQVRSVPAALYKALGGLATNGINVVRLESYISLATPNVAQFYAEIEGHPAEKAVDQALEELQFFSSKMKILGVYPANRFRRMAHND